MISDDIATFIPARLLKFVEDTGTLLPAYVTEWGFLNSAYPTGQARYQAFVDLYAALAGPGVRVDAAIHYGLDDFTGGKKWIVRPDDYEPLPEARFFRQFRRMSISEAA